MKTVLALESATEACSVALLVEGRVLERFELAPRGHAERLLPWAEALLAEAGIARSAIDRIACGRGPGSFTGVRLALATAQGLALGLDRPLVTVSTLAALAQTVLDADRGPVLALIDARMDELYGGLFEADQQGLASALGEAWLARPEAVVATAARWRASPEPGLAAGRLPAAVTAIPAWPEACWPRAGAIARIACAATAVPGDAALAEPEYLRNRVALTLAEQQGRRR